MAKKKKGKKKRVETEEKPSNPLPDGARALFLTGKSQQRYGLQNGELLKDVVDYFEFDIETIVNEVYSLGVLCDFHGVQDELVALLNSGEDKFYCFSDREETFGKNWVVCLTPSAQEFFMKIQREKEEVAAVANNRTIMKNEDVYSLTIETELRRLEKLTYKAVPIIPGQYVSETQDKTFEDIAATNLYLTTRNEDNSAEELFCSSFLRERKFYGAKENFHDASENENITASFRSHKDPKFGLSRKCRDVGIQLSNSFTFQYLECSDFRLSNKIDNFNSKKLIYANVNVGNSKSASTSHNRKIDAAVQFNNLALRRNEDDSRIFHDDQFPFEIYNLLMDKIDLIGQQFIKQSLNQPTDLDLLGDNTQNGVVQPTQNDLIAVKTFTHLDFSKNMRVLGVEIIDLRRRVASLKNLNINTLLVAAYQPNPYLEDCPLNELEWLDLIHNKENLSHILLWKPTDLLKPFIKLFCRRYPTCFTSVHRQGKDTIVGGLVNGQICVWHLDVVAELTSNSCATTRTVYPTGISEVKNSQDSAVVHVEVLEKNYGTSDIIILSASETGNIWLWTSQPHHLPVLPPKHICKFEQKADPQFLFASFTLLDCIENGIDSLSLWGNTMDGNLCMFTPLPLSDFNQPKICSHDVSFVSQIHSFECISLKLVSPVEDYLLSTSVDSVIVFSSQNKLIVWKSSCGLDLNYTYAVLCPDIPSTFGILLNTGIVQIFRLDVDDKVPVYETKLCKEALSSGIIFDQGTFLRFLIGDAKGSVHELLCPKDMSLGKSAGSAPLEELEILEEKKAELNKRLQNKEIINEINRFQTLLNLELPKPEETYEVIADEELLKVEQEYQCLANALNQQLAAGT
eukprot:snap_masked-scaffold_1-processed-gene-31.23-mRNA-1 protein AED:1.00 eAED:1.00 QI:0/-1/0/0/-1/1/1/0/854